MKILTPAKALVFRIIHRDNLDWILEHGIHCRNTDHFDPAFVEIGNPDLIAKRSPRPIPEPPGGTLSDYVPFYFTPRSPMARNINSGRNGVQQRENEEILVLVSSLFHLQDLGLDFLFTDQHAYTKTAQFYSDLERLDIIDWDLLRASDFRRDNDDLGKFERYQAEALVHEHVPITGLLGIGCCNAHEADIQRARVAAAGVDMTVVARPEWYF
jgi:hypothetical protein